MESFRCGKDAESGIKAYNLRIYAMNTVKKALIGTGIVLSSMFAMNANAQNDNIALANNKTVETTNTYSVDIMDLRHKDLKVATIVSARVSKGSIVVYYMGDDINLMNKVRLGASQAKDAGAPVKGMVLAKPDMEFEGGKDSFLILADGLSVTKQADASIYPVGTPRELIIWAFEKYGKELGFVSTSSTKTGSPPNKPEIP